jgi:hypothetical protein
MLRLKFSGGRILSDLRNMSREYNTGARHCYQTNFLFGHYHNERLLFAAQLTGKQQWQECVCTHREYRFNLGQACTLLTAHSSLCVCGRL